MTPKLKMSVFNPMLGARLVFDWLILTKQSSISGDIACKVPAGVTKIPS